MKTTIASKLTKERMSTAAAELTAQERKLVDEVNSSGADRRSKLSQLAVRLISASLLAV